MINYSFPIRAIIKILGDEFKSKTQWYLASTVGDDELREICARQLKHINSLDSYDAINSYLVSYRRLSLQEWIDSL